MRLYSLYPLSSDYKSRLSCMSSCFSLYSPLAPHHNLARYCIQASCPDPALQQQPMHQVRTTFKPFPIALKSMHSIVDSHRIALCFENLCSVLLKLLMMEA